MKNLFVSIIFISLGAGMSLAQQEAKLTHYNYNSLYYNPGFAGIKGAPTFSALYRKQWLGWKSEYDAGGSPRTILVSAEMPILSVKGGAGVTIVSDKLGPMESLTASFSGSKHFDIAGGKLGAGLMVNYNSINFVEDWRPPDGAASIATDESIPKGGNASQGLLDMAGGLWFQREDFYVGLSMTRLLGQEYSFTSPNTSLGGQRKHFYLTGGYNIEASDDLVITPTLMVKSSMSSKGTQFDIGVIANYDETFSGGLNFRQGEAISILLGASVLEDKSLTIGYALDLVVVNSTAKALTSHEVMITKRLPQSKLKLKPPIRSPRFRF